MNLMILENCVLGNSLQENLSVSEYIYLFISMKTIGFHIYIYMYNKKIKRNLDFNKKKSQFSLYM